MDLVDSDIDSENGMMRIYRYIKRTEVKSAIVDNRYYQPSKVTVNEILLSTCCCVRSAIHLLQRHKYYELGRLSPPPNRPAAPERCGNCAVLYGDSEPPPSCRAAALQQCCGTKASIYKGSI